MVSDLIQVARDILGVVIPPESCPFDFIDVQEEGPLREEYHKARRENRVWRWKLAGAIFVLFGFCLWVVFGSGYTRAAELDKKVSEAIKPIQVEIAQVRMTMAQTAQANSALTRAIIEQLAAREADSICRTLVRQKTETDWVEKRRLRNEADEAQERYKEYKKDYYPESRCQG